MRGSRFMRDAIAGGLADRVRAPVSASGPAQAFHEANAARHYARATYESAREAWCERREPRGYDTYAHDARARGERVEPRPTFVAGELFHGPDDRKRSLAQLATAWAALQNDLAVSATLPADAAWVAAVVVPELAEWHDFITRINESDLSIMTVEWQAIASWLERLRRMRVLARTRGITLISPEPVDLPRTIWERGGSGTGSTMDTLLSFARIAVFGVIGVASFVGFFSIVREWKMRQAEERFIAEVEGGHGA